MRVVVWQDFEILVAKCGETIYAIENRCTHEDAPLDQGKLNVSACTIECARHGSIFDLHSGRPLCLPAYEPIDTFAVSVDGGEITVAVE